MGVSVDVKVSVSGEDWQPDFKAKLTGMLRRMSYDVYGMIWCDVLYDIMLWCVYYDLFDVMWIILRVHNDVYVMMLCHVMMYVLLYLCYDVYNKMWTIWRVRSIVVTYMFWSLGYDVYVMMYMLYGEDDVSDGRTIRKSSSKIEKEWVNS